MTLSLGPGAPFAHAERIAGEFAGAIYHVLVQGNERKPIVRDDADCKRWLATIAEAVERFGLGVHGYCLMPNHSHLLVETSRANLCEAIGWGPTTYTVRFHHRHRSEAIPRERTKEWEAYEWSSHRDYVGRRRAPKWVSQERPHLWGRTVTEARKEYRREMESRLASR